MKVEQTDMSPSSKPTPVARLPNDPPRLKLYVARSTPNSQRAEANLSIVMDGLKGQLPQPTLEIIDVFSQPKRALTEGVVVTPTLIGVNARKRIVLMGDLTDHIQLQRVILDLCRTELPTQDEPQRREP